MNFFKYNFFKINKISLSLLVLLASPLVAGGELEHITTNSGRTVSIHQKKISEDLYLVVEDVDNEGFCKWNQICPLMRESLQSRSTKKIAETFGQLDALYFFSDTLERTYSNPRYKDIKAHVAYALDQDIHSIDDNEDGWEKHVELFFGVFHTPSDPFTMHIGIMRNPLYEGARHPNISVRLHAFAAEALKSAHPKKTFMITRPLRSMWDIFEKAMEEKGLPQENIIVPDELSEERYKWYELISARDFSISFEGLINLGE